MGIESPLYRQFDVTFTTGTGVAYSANDQMGDLQTLSKFFQNTTQVWQFAGGSLVDTDNTGAFTYSIFFWYKQVTLAADNAAYSMSDADAIFFAGMTGSPGSAGNTVSAGGLNRLYCMPYYQGTSQNPTGEFYLCRNSSDDLYVSMINTGATPAAARTTANSLKLKLLFELITP